jgi:transcriptional regulator of heat shock response
MTATRVEYERRKEIILGIVVNEYIHSVNPVSSAYIAQEHVFDLSPATIRNILAELEEQGFLTHPHTSAGRIPTEAGYRFYVNNIMNEIQLLEEEKSRIKQEYDQKVRDLELILDKTSKVLSEVTYYTAIVSVNDQHGRLFCRGASHVVEYLDWQDSLQIQQILQLLEEKERLLALINCDLQRKIKIYIGHELACENMQVCSLAVSSFRLAEGPSGRIAVLGPTRMNYEKVVSALDYVSRVMEEQFI